jgi:Arc/MetJ family transcription regulator
MHPRPPWSVCLSGFLFIALSLWIKPNLHAGFRAGASAVDIAPQSWPVRVNAMFTERNADHVEDALWAKSLSLGQGDETIILCVVDTCMMPRDLIDQAKQQVQVMTGVSTDRMMVSATHTHSNAWSPLASHGPKKTTGIIRSTGDGSVGLIGCLRIHSERSTYGLTCTRAMKVSMPLLPVAR